MFCHAKDNCQFCMVIKKFPGIGLWRYLTIIEWMLLVYNYVVKIKHYFVFLERVFCSQSEWLFFSYVWARTPNKKAYGYFDHSIFDSKESQRYCVILSIYLSYKVINSTNRRFLTLVAASYQHRIIRHISVVVLVDWGSLRPLSCLVRVHWYLV